jgi:Membrane proteins related to metalloendopeptidases
MKNLSYPLIATVFLIGCSDDPVKPGTDKDPDKDAPKISKEIGPLGGSIAMDDVVNVNFPPNSFNEETIVTITQSSKDPEMHEYYDHASLFFNADNYLEYFAKINTGKGYPNGDIQVQLTLSDAIISSIKDGYKYEVLALLNQSDGDESIISFDPVAATYNIAQKYLELTLENFYFNNTLTGDDSWEAVLTIATLPGQNPTGRSKADDCEGIYISCPLASCQVRSPFNPGRPHPITGEVKPHKGVDLAAPLNTQVKAAFDGVVVSVREEKDKNGKLKGYGKYITIRHDNTKGQTFSTLYAHLNEALVHAGEKVLEGQVIAMSGNTGGSTGPHLHFEYFINANAGNLNQRIDPMPLINTTSIRLISASASLTGINNCSDGTRSTWKVIFDYRDPSNQIDPDATLTFQDVEPVNNPPYTVKVGSLVSQDGLVNSPDFCARFGDLTYFKVRVYLTSKGVNSNCIYFYLNKTGDAMRAIAEGNQGGKVGTTNL